MSTLLLGVQGTRRLYSNFPQSSSKSRTNSGEQLNAPPLEDFFLNLSSCWATISSGLRNILVSLYQTHMTDFWSGPTGSEVTEMPICTAGKNEPINQQTRWRSVASSLILGGDASCLCTDLWQVQGDIWWGKNILFTLQVHKVCINASENTVC